MAKAHSFVITLSNNKTEKEGMEFVMETSSDLFHPDSIGRKELLKVLGLSGGFRKAFDLVRVAGANRNHGLLEIPTPEAVTLIELKTTKKRLPNNPYGFFFGATENEFKLAEEMGERFNFAFVCLHPETQSVKFYSLNKLRPLIQKQRTQFQINLKKSPAESAI